MRAHILFPAPTRYYQRLHGVFRYTCDIMNLSLILFNVQGSYVNWEDYDFNYESNQFQLEREFSRWGRR